jgi:hypothetical protein
MIRPVRLTVLLSRTFVVAILIFQQAKIDRPIFAEHQDCVGLYKDFIKESGRFPSSGHVFLKKSWQLYPVGTATVIIIFNQI